MEKLIIPGITYVVWLFFVYLVAKKAKNVRVCVTQQYNINAKVAKFCFAGWHIFATSGSCAFRAKSR